MKAVEDISEVRLQRDSICWLLSRRAVDNDDPLSKKEIEQATLYWETFVSNPIGEREACVNCSSGMVRSFSLMTDDPAQTRKAIRTHLELGTSSKCPDCSNRHFTLSEALSYHSEFLRCHVKKDVNGALNAARKRCELIQGLGSSGG